jgi:sec-independent protein translocase protein TatA
MNTLAFLPSIGLPEMLIIGAVFMLLFGAKKLPQLAKGCADSVRELRSAVKPVKDEIDDLKEDLGGR